MAAFDDVVIISGCRTAVGKFQGSLSDLSAPQLGAVVEIAGLLGVPAPFSRSILGLARLISP